MKEKQSRGSGWSRLPLDGQVGLEETLGAQMMESSDKTKPVGDKLEYPESTLLDGDVALRPWEPRDLPLVERASRDQALLAGTTLPRHYSDYEGQAFIERQLSRERTGEGVSFVSLRVNDRLAVLR